MTVGGQQIPEHRERSDTRSGNHYSGVPESPTRQSRLWSLTGVSLACVVLAVPFLAMLISIDLDFGGRWMCAPRPVGGFGAVYDGDGVFVCQFQVARVFGFWIVMAAIVSPLPVSGYVIYERNQRRRVPKGAVNVGNVSVLSATTVSTGVLGAISTAAVLVVIFGGYTLVTFLVTGLPAGKWCLCSGAVSAGTSQINGLGTASGCCSVDLGKALYSLAIYPLLALLFTVSAMYLYRKFRSVSGEREFR